MKQWEYKILDSRLLPGGGKFKGKEKDIVDMFLSKIGRDGWEIMSIDFREINKGYEFTGVAKREITEE
jgi:hypothetical protein